MKCRFLALCVTLALVLLGPCVGLAASCTVSATGLEFGVFATPGVPPETMGRVTITCQGTPGEHVAYALYLPRGGAEMRRMSAGRYGLPYNLFLDSARLTPWGDGTGGTAVLRGEMDLAGQLAIREHVIYGRVLPLRATVPGIYADATAVVLEYED